MTVPFKLSQSYIYYMSTSEKKVLLFLMPATLIAAYFFMYQVISMPYDETSHAISLMLVSLAWAFTAFLFFGFLFVKNIKHRSARYAYGGLILMLPAALAFLYISFFQIFYYKIIEIHPIWTGNMSAELLDLSSIDDVHIALFVALVFLGIGVALLRFSGKKNATD